MAQNANNYPSDSVDLRELAQTLWTSKILIIIVALIVTCLAITYAFMAKPIYETTVQTLPPTASGLNSYNVASQLTGGAISGIVEGATPLIAPLSPQEVYKAFLRHLNSSTIKQVFFEQHYLPAQEQNETERDKQQAWQRLDKELTISVPLKTDEYEARVTLEGTNARTIAGWANTYVDLAMRATVKDLHSDLVGQVEIRLHSLKDQIATLRQVAIVTRKARITRLKEALTIAESIGLDQPPNGTPLISLGGGRDTETIASGSMLYLRGANALRSELDQLQERENDDAYIFELSDLFKKQALLHSINLDPQLISVATVDRAAIVPEDPVKPRKRLIVLLGIIFGVMLGIFLALIRHLTHPIVLAEHTRLRVKTPNQE